MKTQKNKKTIILTVIVFILLVVIGGILLSRSMNNLKAYEIKNIKKVNVDLPYFYFTIRDEKETIDVTMDSFAKRKIDIYKFDAGINTSWGVETMKFTGFKLLDLLSLFGKDDYDEIDFGGIGGNHVVLSKEEIDDNVYLYFYRDGKKISDGYNINLLVENQKYKYSVEDLGDILLKKGEVQNEK